ncbi:class D beta-lactamase [Hymenobacter taeanensis]|uniref:Beta-lactamase n=1 Tax=Hymenobacter taeanensis TaxID=2735321 RepID=A0A6M6BEU5_9BACT|nr:MULTISPECIES: class D beta-lactamase [Hymenobacter]QJX45685.1 class D beta-lactamase [Hymenobacter taeanensis]UOQ79523.1 class D beta-lactamase [Hymenobacter sp. 5414T-23]
MLRICLLLLSLGSILLLGATPAPIITERNFQAHFDHYGVKGSILLFEKPAGRYVAYNLQRCRQGFLPASTFKIPNTLIGLQTGALPDTATMCKWDGVQRKFPQWNHDMTYAQALRVSCVPCYQQLARRVGVESYHQWLRKLAYGHMDVTPQNLDGFWLDGNSRITQFEQLDFLQRLHAEKLPIATQHQRAVKRILQLQKTPEYTLYGKTGWTFSSATNVDNGWFVGWLDRADGRTIYFALNIEPQSGSANDQFINARRAITEAVLREMKWL